MIPFVGSVPVYSAGQAIKGINMGFRNNKLNTFWVYFEKENGFKPVSGKIDLPFGLPKKINLAQFLAMFRDDKNIIYAKEYMDLPGFKVHLKDEKKGYDSAISYLYIQ